ncbi:hypothetical protein HW423_07100 [Aerococcaceae bacterium INB8]|uniref:Uncharacterized protein n=1 Tax=Ruoffia halotolerans TaxID=2748684 RepID=A0A839A5S9_9LACT|nr:hypothetical protein [Ruoffia halotolerans]MBA5729549.1 hypothetical protein [Ruoffia halotolerans]
MSHDINRSDSFDIDYIPALVVIGETVIKEPIAHNWFMKNLIIFANHQQ